MGIRMDIKRTGFYSELDDDRRKEYFSAKSHKTISTIDNLYYTVFISGDGKNYNNMAIHSLISDLEINKAETEEIKEPVLYMDGLYCMLKSYKNYVFCLSDPDLYDIFFCRNLPNDETPRIVVQLRAFGLWTKGTEELLESSFAKVKAVLEAHGCAVDWCRESRIDYCYHTNTIQSLNKLFKENSEGKVKNLHSNLQNVTWNADKIQEDDGTIFIKNYLCFGRIKSNNVRARIYDKVKEVIENGYKGFFFEIWHNNGLISYYDKWCMEYALQHRNTKYLYKAALEFYVEHGDDGVLKAEFWKALSSPKTTLAAFKKLSEKHMPSITTIINIEYETKRKFYYYSDNFIDNFKLSDNKGDISKPLERIYKILEYREVFIDYLTSQTLSFHKGIDKDGNYLYLAWWERLRNTKHGGVKTDLKLLRVYSKNMDKKLVEKKLVNTLASASVYENRLGTTFVEDFSDLLADISDNEAHKMGIRFYNNDGKEIHDVLGSAVRDYNITKQRKQILLKNRTLKNSNNQASV